MNPNDLSLTTELAKYGILVLGLGYATVSLWRRNHSLTELVIEREKQHSKELCEAEAKHYEEREKMVKEHSRTLLQAQENHMLQQHSTATQVMRSFFSASLATPKDLVGSSIKSSGRDD